MAYLDVKEYFLQVEDQYLSTKKEVENYKNLANQGLMSKEHLDIIEDNLLGLEVNYKRLAYVMYLFNKPKSTKKRNKIKDDLEDKFEFIGVTKTQIIDENTNLINSIRKYIDDSTKKEE